MNEYDRMIGAFEEFRHWEREEHATIRTELKEIKEKLDDISTFRWKLVGASGVLSIVVSAVATILIKHIQ